MTRKLTYALGDRAFALLMGIVKFAGWGHVRYPGRTWEEFAYKTRSQRQSTAGWL